MACSYPNIVIVPNLEVWKSVGDTPNQGLFLPNLKIKYGDLYIQTTVPPSAMPLGIYKRLGPVQSYPSASILAASSACKRSSSRVVACQHQPPRPPPTNQPTKPINSPIQPRCDTDVPNGPWCSDKTVLWMWITFDLLSWPLSNARRQTWKNVHRTCHKLKYCDVLRTPQTRSVSLSPSLSVSACISVTYIPIYIHNYITYIFSVPVQIIRIYTMFFYVHGVWQELGFIGVSSNVATPIHVVYDGQPERTSVQPKSIRWPNPPKKTSWPPLHFSIVLCSRFQFLLSAKC